MKKTLAVLSLIAFAVLFAQEVQGPRNPATFATLGYAVGGGTAQAQTVTPSSSKASSLQNGLTICWLPAAANTGAAPTLAYNGLTAKPVTKLGTTALILNDITTAAIACAIYDGTEWQLQNPQTATGGTGPYVIASNTATATADGAWTALAFTTNSAGSSSTLHNTSTNTNKFLVPTTGLYQGDFFYKSTGTPVAGDWGIAIRINGTNYTGPQFSTPPTTLGMAMAVHMTFELTAGDYAECVVYVSAASPISADNGATFTTRMFWKGPL